MDVMVKLDFHQKLGDDYIFYFLGMSAKNRLRPHRLDCEFTHTKNLQNTGKYEFCVSSQVANKNMITHLRNRALPEFENVSDVATFDWLVTGQAPESSFTFETKNSNFAREWLRKYDKTKRCLIRCSPIRTDVTTPEEILIEKKQYETYFGENL